MAEVDYPPPDPHRGLLHEARLHMPADRQRRPTLTVVGRIQDGDWVRLPGHLDWRRAAGGVITIGPMTRVLWKDRFGGLNRDMLMTEAPCEVVHGGDTAPGIASA